MEMFGVTTIDLDMSLRLSAELRPIGFPKFNLAQDLPSLLPCSVDAVFRSGRPTIDHVKDSHVTHNSMSLRAGKGQESCSPR
jgi:hypothetical protein